ncbi:hypothetical protein SDC9_66534 [bioreactor metagenome]|uniref:GGDEF domain-containing protein n=1 Tax=bioreactor metagenome TaxID=1076179 RepID=A0A644XVA6_9ZZZZ|nr:GGDEF domain-containing protein [Oscillospiraceae bacterium]
MLKKNGLFWSYKSYVADMTDAEQKRLGKYMLDTSIRRSVMAVLLSAAVELSSVLVGLSAQIIQNYRGYYLLSGFALLCDAAMFYVLSLLSKNNIIRSEKLKRSLFDLFWLFFSIFLLLFSGVEVAETGSISNFITLILVTGIIPYFKLFEILPLLIIDASGMIYVILHYSCPVFHIQQILILSVIAFVISRYSYRFFVCSSVDNRLLDIANDELKKLNEKLSELSVTDELTSLLNRRGFEYEINMLWEKCLREKRSLSALMIDIDNFKSYNDTFGHVSGDKCLRQIANAIRSCARKYDIVARYGGEEFCVIFDAVDKITILEIAIRIRLSVEALKIQDAVSGYVSVSIGAATVLPDRNNEPKNLIRNADEQLYRAKSEGKNRVCFFDV